MIRKNTVRSPGKRVLMLLENNPYPQDPRVRREAMTLAEAGYKVSVVCPDAAGQPRREVLDGVRVYRYPAPRGGDGFVGYMWEYGYSMVASFVLSAVVLLNGGFDVIHAHNPPDTFVAIAALYKIFGKRFIYDHHDLAPEGYAERFRTGGNRLVHRALLFFEGLSCKLADHVIATNEHYRQVDMERACVPAERITVVRNGPDLACFEPDPVGTGSRSNGKQTIGYVGRIGVQDHVDILLRALHHLVYDLERENFQFLMVGDGVALPSLKAMVVDLELDDYVSFTGWVEPSEVAEYLRMMDICVAPEPSDPFHDRSTANAVMEYMAMCKPVVAFDLPEHHFTAQEGAVYARVNDELDFARQLAVLMDNPERCVQMGQAGRARVEEALGWHCQAQFLLQVYEALLGARV